MLEMVLLYSRNTPMIFPTSVAVILSLKGNRTKLSTFNVWFRLCKDNDSRRREKKDWYIEEPNQLEYQ